MYFLVSLTVTSTQTKITVGGRYTKERIQRVWCPFCGAAPYTPCKNNKERNHLQRMQKYQKFMNKKLKERKPKNGRIRQQK